MTREPEESATGFRRVYLEWKERDIQAQPEKLSAREFDNGVAESTGGTAGRI